MEISWCAALLKETRRKAESVLFVEKCRSRRRHLNGKCCELGEENKSDTVDSLRRKYYTNTVDEHYSEFSKAAKSV